MGIFCHITVRDPLTIATIASSLLSSSEYNPNRLESFWIKADYSSKKSKLW